MNTEKKASSWLHLLLFPKPFCGKWYIVCCCFLSDVCNQLHSLQIRYQVRAWCYHIGPRWNSFDLHRPQSHFDRNNSTRHPFIGCTSPYILWPSLWAYHTVNTTMTMGATVTKTVTVRKGTRWSEANDIAGWLTNCLRLKLLMTYRTKHCANAYESWVYRSV